MAKGIAVLIASMKKDKQMNPENKVQSKLKELLGTSDSGSDSDDKSGEEEGLKNAMEDFIGAVHGKDVEGAIEAFKDLMTLCKPGSHEDDEDYISNDDSHSGGTLSEDNE